MNWLKICRGKIKFNEPLSKHTSFKIGGEALIWFEPNSFNDLAICLRSLYENKTPYFVIGNGTNILVKDSGFKGVVIRLSSPNFKRIKIDRKNRSIRVGAGASLMAFLNFLVVRGIYGYEFLAGIPGTLGGAIVMNAGVKLNDKRKEIGSFVKKITAMQANGTIKELTKGQLFFDYRSSNLEKYIVLEAELKIVRIDSQDPDNRIQDYLLYRKQRLDCSFPNAGSIFKNPSDAIAAGYLIDRCGLKGLRIGGAIVSNKHANFILNFNNAKAEDVLKLINKIKSDVKKSFGIKLEEEIKIVS